MVNQSKSRDSRFWAKWEKSGAVGTLENRAMSLDESISMEPVKEKLRNLHDYMPGQEDLTYRFGAYLAERLDSELFPEGFNMAADLALYDLQKGVNGFTGEPIRSSLVGYPSVIYSILRKQVPNIAKAVCPKDFASEVRDFYEKVNAEISK